MISKKRIYGLALGLLALLVLFIYNAFNGNPASKWLAQQSLEQYLKEQYPELELRVKKASYTFKNEEYIFEAVIIGGVEQEANPPGEFEFRMRGGIWPTTVAADGLYTSRLDEEKMEQLGREASAELQALLQPQVPSLRLVETHVEVLRGQLPAGASWSRELALPKPPWLYMVLDASQSSREELLEAAARIQTLLEEGGYVYRSVTINANRYGDSAEQGKDARGRVTYVIRFDSQTELKLDDVQAQQ